jgi:hypothetical protein
MNKVKKGTKSLSQNSWPLGPDLNSLSPRHKLQTPLLGHADETKK